MFNTTKLTDKGNGFQLAQTEGISDITLMGVAIEYKTNVSRKYKTLPARLMVQTFTQIGKVFSSIKYDGEGTFLFFDADKDICAVFNAPSGRTRLGLPCIEEAKKKLIAKGVKKGLFACEIYVKDEKLRTQVSDVIHITFNGSKEQRETLTLAVYDIIMLDGVDYRHNQSKFETNLAKITDIFGKEYKTDKCHVVEGNLIAGSEVQKWFEEVTKTLGEEGIVVRNLETVDIYKIKPSITVDAVVIGYVEGDFEGMYGITSLLCGLYDKESKKVQTLTRVGSGFTDDQRIQLLEPLSKLKVKSPLDMTDSDGRPISFVTPQMVIEVEGESLVRENFQGKENTAQTFTWSGKEYEFNGLNKSPLLTHATFAKFRDDKIWDDGGTRMEQVLTAVEIGSLASKKIREIGKPEIVVREVYTKETKGITAVRKIIVVKTNNEDSFPLIVHWTDYSAGRKDPLKTETKVAETMARADALVVSYREEASKKGWNKV